jgi:predicted nucleic acid-binding protein
MYLLDTNVISEISRGDQGNRNVQTWYDTIAPEQFCTSVLVIGEIRAGVEKLRRREAKRAMAFERHLVLLIDLFADRIVGIDRRTAEEWGRLNARRIRPAIDGLIAATALVRDMTVVTRNVRDFAETGVAVLNPFEPPTSAPEPS